MGVHGAARRAEQPMYYSTAGMLVAALQLHFVLKA